MIRRRLVVDLSSEWAEHQPTALLKTREYYIIMKATIKLVKRFLLPEKYRIK